VIIPSARRRLPLAVALAAAIFGTIVAVRYHHLGLTLTHYDARGHLVVARRVIDSITPGWQQIGAVWLPLPHLLNLLPVQIDLFYRTGASAIAISIVSFAVASGAIAAIVLEITSSQIAAVAAAAVFALNPNVLYLQSTPMTEPLLVALTAVAIAMIVCRPEPLEDPPYTRRVGVVFALACLTRYEAWPITAIALTLYAWARWRAGETMRDALRATARIALWPAAAIAAFAIFSRVVVGAWFVGTDFYVPENKALGDLRMAVKEIGWGLARLSSEPLAWVGGIGMAAIALAATLRRDRARTIVALALAASAAIPLAAFYKGHPFRVRYMVPLLAVEAIGAGAAAGIVRQTRAAGPIALIALAASTLRPLDRSAPMIVEAQWDTPNVPVRARVTDCLRHRSRGQKIMASMGSLGHYMQEASGAGLAIRDFLHEGNGDIWLAALEYPRPFADWILIEEKAEGGDMLARRAREHPAFLEGYSRVCEGAGLALYRRD